MTNSPTTIRIDDQLKKEATAVLDEVGLNLNRYLNLALRQLVVQKRVPFEIVTQAAKDEAAAPVQGIGEAILRLGERRH